jgi:hypothetical protein
MTFMRIQEFYESPSSKFRGKYFEFEEFMEWYSFQYGETGDFKYATHWKGFNIPGKVFSEWISAYDFDDMAHFRDREVKLFEKLIAKEVPLYNFEGYLIAVAEDDENLQCTIDHELAHALFHLDKDYKKKCLALINELAPEKVKKYEDNLIKEGYAKKVLKDEIQAYAATGPSKTIKIPKNKKFASLFEETIKEKK